MRTLFRLIGGAALFAVLISGAAFSQNPGFLISGAVTAGHCIKFIDKFHGQDSGAVCGGSQPVGANPTASVGASAVNGSAATFMRSDAAPPLAAGAAAANVGTLGGVLGGTLPNPSMAAGAASTNIGTLGGVLGGTLPNPSMAAGAALANIGSIANGHLIANGTGGAANPADTAPSTWLDQAYCSTIGRLIVRVTGVWTCRATVYAEPYYWDTSCGTLAHDCTTALATCVASGSPCLIRAGQTIAVSSATILSVAGQSIVGQGAASVIEMLTAGGTAHIIDFTVIGIRISNLSLVYQTQPSSGGIAVFENNTAASGGNVSMTIVEKLFINNANYGLYLLNGLENVYRDIFILNAKTIGVSFDSSGVYLMKNVSAAGQMASAALYIHGNSGGIIEDGEWESATGYGLDIEADGGNLAWNFSRISNVFFDNPAKGNRIAGAYNDVFDNSYYSTNVLSGPVGYSCLEVLGATTTHLTFLGNQFPNCGENGVLLTAGSYIILSSNQVLNNGLLTASTYAGINVGAAISEFEIIGNMITGVNQVDGVFVNASATHGSVQYNLLNGNVAGINLPCPATVSCQAANY